MAFRRGIWGDWAVALGMWSCLGFALGWYQSFTTYGARGWPLPMIEPMAGKFLYLFAVSSVPHGFKTFLWILAYPVAGVMWAILLCVTAPTFKQAPPRFCDALRDLAWASSPVVLLGLAVTVAAWIGRWGFWWDVPEFIGWPLRPSSPWPWLGLVYGIAGGIGLSIQLATLWFWSDRRLRHYLGYLLLNVFLLLVSCSGLGALAAWIIVIV
ncbi:MAG TPA: hypothetical protein PKZ01_04945 [Candidatus Hydrogenedentes bacterium]|nr:hypothetical protein [Candidatus Hydrogenedentota bacterium]